MDNESNGAPVICLLHDGADRFRWYIEYPARGMGLIPLSTTVMEVDLSELRKKPFDDDDDLRSVSDIGGQLFHSLALPEPELHRKIGELGVQLGGHEDQVTISLAGPEWLLEVPLEYMVHRPEFPHSCNVPWVKRFPVVRQLTGVRSSPHVPAHRSEGAKGEGVLLLAMNRQPDTIEEIRSLVSDCSDRPVLSRLHVAYVEPPHFPRSLLAALRCIGKSRPESDRIENWREYDVVFLIGGESENIISSLGDLQRDARTQLFVSTADSESLLRNSRGLLVQSPRDVLAFRGRGMRDAARRTALSLIERVLIKGTSPASALLHLRADKRNTQWWAPILLSNHRSGRKGSPVSERRRR